MTAPARPRLSRRLARGGIAIVLFAAVVAAYYAVRSAYYEYRLRAVVATLDAAGPWRVADLDAARAAVADAANAAPVVKDMAARVMPPLRTFAGPFVPFTSERGSTYPPDRRYDGELSDELANVIELCGDVWADWPALLARPTGRSPMVRTADGMVMLPQVDQSRTVAMAGRWLALFFAEANRPAEATQAVRGSLHAANATGDEPWTISHHVRLVEYGVAVETLERVLAQCEPGDADLAPLADLFAAEAARPTWKLMLIGDRAAVDDDLCQLQAGGPAVTWLLDRRSPRGPVTRAMDRLRERTGVEVRPMHAELLEAYTAAIAAADGPPDRQAAAAAALDARREASLAGTELTAWLERPVAKLLARHNHLLARIESARVAVAAERHRLRTGEYPAAVPDTPVRYERTATGATAGEFRLFLPAHRRRPPSP